MMIRLSRAATTAMGKSCRLNVGGRSRWRIGRRGVSRAVATGTALGIYGYVRGFAVIFGQNFG
jgi:hypothetical protein